MYIHEARSELISSLNRYLDRFRLLLPILHILLVFPSSKGDPFTDRINIFIATRRGTISLCIERKEKKKMSVAVELDFLFIFFIFFLYGSTLSLSLCVIPLYMLVKIKRGKGKKREKKKKGRKTRMKDNETRRIGCVYIYRR